IVAPLLLLLSFSIFSQDDDDDIIVFSENKFMVLMDENTPEDSVQAYLAELNAVEVWNDDDIDLCLWEVTSFPFTSPDGELITNINEVIRKSKSKTKIQDATFNIQYQIQDPDTMLTSCFNVNNYQIQAGQGR
ncbi:MAG: hypothetical protein AAGK97_11775, partial [Bacteroidota bacterium]